MLNIASENRCNGWFFKNATARAISFGLGASPQPAGKPSYLALRIRSGFGLQSLGKGFRLLIGEVSVEQLQGLWSVRGGLSSGASQQSIGLIEAFHEGKAQVALRDQVDAPAIVLLGIARHLPLSGLIEGSHKLGRYRHHHTGAAYRRIQLAGGGKHRVPELFRIQTLAGEPPQQLVLWILLCDQSLPGCGRRLRR